MMQRWNISKGWSASVVLVAAISSSSAAAESVALCKELSKFSLQSAARTSVTNKYQLYETVPIGGQPGQEQYYNLDIDGDDISDLIDQSCPGSTEMPADPCMLSMKLSSSGKTFEFEAWGLLLFRYKGQILIAANADETRKKTNIYKINKSGFELVCAKL